MITPARFPATAMALALVTTVLAGCTGTGDYGPKQTVAALGGAGLGALAGASVVDGDARIVGAALGTVIGGLLGNEAGKSLDRADRTAARQAQVSALEFEPTGSSTTWRNPDSGAGGTITPVRSFKTASGTPCREFQHKAKIAGKTQYLYGTACRSDDGQWQVLNP